MLRVTFRMLSDDHIANPPFVDINFVSLLLFSLYRHEKCMGPSLKRQGICAQLGLLGSPACITSCVIPLTLFFFLCSSVFPTRSWHSRASLQLAVGVVDSSLTHGRVGIFRSPYLHISFSCSYHIPGTRITCI